MIEIILNSGTTWVVPNDWNDADNSIETWGAGGAGRGNHTAKSSAGRPGGGAGAYSRGDNIPLTPGATIPIRIGSGGIGNVNNAVAPSGGDTCFNATSLANAVSNGESVSVAAEGGYGGDSSGNAPGGNSANGVGNHTKTSGASGGGPSAGASGAGGNSPNGGTGGAAVGSSGPGLPGNVPGGGGSGAKGSAIEPGGDGANGRIRIIYEPVAGQHRMFLVFSSVAATLLSGWGALIGAVGSVVAKRPRGMPQVAA